MSPALRSPAPSLIRKAFCLLSFISYSFFIYTTQFKPVIESKIGLFHLPFELKIRSGVMNPFPDQSHYLAYMV